MLDSLSVLVELLSSLLVTDDGGWLRLHGTTGRGVTLGEGTLGAENTNRRWATSDVETFTVETRAAVASVFVTEDVDCRWIAVDEVTLGVEGFGTEFDESMPEVENTDGCVAATFEDVVVETGCRGAARLDEVMLGCVVLTDGVVFKDICWPVTLDTVVTGNCRWMPNAVPTVVDGAPVDCNVLLRPLMDDGESRLYEVSWAL